MSACPSCAATFVGDPRFCSQCGAPLGSQIGAEPVEERKVVSVLFCDLVAFTAQAESSDPEDVSGMLDAYAVVARSAIESFGGTVEKFIGDAVVGVFGVPAAHEDDPERAVRAALRIVEDAERLTGADGSPLRLRVGVNTGEALVRLDVRAGTGARFMAGDAVNTASRVQSVAPVMGVAVGAATYRSTAALFDYVELEPAQVKGKSAPLRVYRPRAPLASFGTDLARVHETRLMGRASELTRLSTAFELAATTSSPQVVTVVGDPGLGKSRLVAELFRVVDERPGLVTWRQGRCLPYGRGITFWALGEIVKAHAGILETDEQDVAVAKLDLVLPPGPERAWFRQRLLPLLGIEAASSAERDELFTAWRRFLEHIASSGPAVLVLEDLHWADVAMLDFLDHLADHATGVPLLVIGTTRPELLDHRPVVGSGGEHISSVRLAPLTESDTALLLLGLLDASALPAALQQSILDRAGGNPLYAEEFVRLLRDRSLIVRQGGTWAFRDGAQLPTPDSVHSLIAARLDLLSPEAKSLLADAAVVGKVFWAGAVAEMSGRDREDTASLLDGLAERNLVRQAQRSSMAGETEFSFWHVLTLDVAYGQLTRSARAVRHVAAARWIEAKAGGRVEDLADVLAHHYATAHELATATRDTVLADSLLEPALRFLALAGDRAMGLDTAAALAAFETVLGLMPADHPQRARMLARYGLAATQAGRYGVASAALEEAVRGLRAEGDLEAAADTLLTLRLVYSKAGDPRATELNAEVPLLLEQLPPGRTRVRALAVMARLELNFLARPDLGRLRADEALALAAELGLDPPTDAMGVRGTAAVYLGDRTGMLDLEQAIALGKATGQGAAVGSEYNNLGLAGWIFDGPAAGIDTLRAGIAHDAPRGLGDALDLTEGTLLSVLYDAGEHAEALERAAHLADRFTAGGNMLELTEVRAIQTRIHHLRGQSGRADSWLDWLETVSRDAGRPEDLVVGLVPCAAAHAALGRTTRAVALLTEIEATPLSRRAFYYPTLLPWAVRTCLDLGRRDLAAAFATDVAPLNPYLDHALATVAAALLEADGDHAGAAAAYADVAARWARFGVAPERLAALVGHGRCLVAAGRPHDAKATLGQALSLAGALSAAPARREIDLLLDDLTALTS